MEWDAAARQWIFLPRKASREPFHVQADETRGTNLLIVASEDFFDIQVRCHAARRMPIATLTCARRCAALAPCSPSTASRQSEVRIMG